jgi:IS5 family transposase
MAWKNLKQLSLADSLTSEHEALTELDGINELMDWEAIEHLLGDIHAKRRGNSAWPPVFMFKALLLQSWYSLSDPKLERLLVRDLLFRRFVSLSLADSVPDHSSIWRFRQLLEKQGLMASLLAEINLQLSIQGLYIRAGEISIIDASVVQAQSNRPNKDKDGNNTQHSEASWNVKQGSDGMGQARYLGLARKRIRFGVMCLAYNLRRGANIKKSCETPHYSCA